MIGEITKREGQLLTPALRVTNNTRRPIIIAQRHALMVIDGTINDIVNDANFDGTRRAKHEVLLRSIMTRDTRSLKAEKRQYDLSAAHGTAA